jgi:hypothetical protein
MKTTFLSISEASRVLSQPDCKFYCIGGTIDLESKVAIFYRGDLSSIRVSFSTFIPLENGTSPDFRKFSIGDCGKTICFGRYEKDFDWVIVEWENGSDKTTRNYF